ncbi:MAG: membrane protein insertase YidC [Clostridium sp.]
MSFFAPITEFFKILFEKILDIVGTFGIDDRGTVIILSVFILTALVRLAVLPFSIKSAKATQKMQEIQPEVKKLQEKYKNDPEKQNMEVMKLYRERKVSMTGGCLPMLLPLPILMALYYVFMGMPGIEGVSFLWVKDLATKDTTFILPILAALSTYLPSYLMSKASPSQAEGGMNMGAMNIGMAAMMGVMAINFQSILVIYWVLGGVIQLVQTYFINYLPAMKRRQEQEVIVEEKEQLGKHRFALEEDDSKKKKKKKK